MKLAQDFIKLRFTEGRHHVEAALRTKQGGVFSAVHFEASVGRTAICAAAIALGMAVAEGDTEVDAIVAMDRNGNLMPPCGMCREMLADYAPKARVLISKL